MTLWKQAFRSIWRNKRSYLACIVLLVVGIAVFVSFHLLFRNVSAAMEGMYRSQQFADGFARVGGIPKSALESLAGIPGIGQVDGTVTADARVMNTGSPKIVTLRLNSYLPEDDGRLNDFILVEGNMPQENQLLVGEEFALARGLELGSVLELVLGGQAARFTIAGLVQSPEYIYAIPDTGQIMPDTEAFGFAFVPEDKLAVLAGMEGSYNSVAFLLEGGVEFRQVEPQLEEALATYGLLSLTSRKNQPSHGMLQQEVDSIEAMSTSMPMLFIMLAVIILYIMMRRMIQQERAQIGTMKAFGLSDSRVVVHYLGYGFIIGVAGGVVGVVSGIMMTSAITELYLEFFSLPSMKVPPDPAILAMGMLLALGSGVLGTFMGARSILRLSPSDAMRPAAPPGIKNDLVSKLPFLRKVLNSLGFMAVRNISRNRFRSAFVVLGVAISFGLTAFLASFGDMFDYMLFDQFTKVERYNLKISLQEPMPYTPALESAYALEGVRRAEGLLELPVELRSGHLKESVPLVGIEANSDLYLVYDSDKQVTYQPPTGGLILSGTLAEKLQVSRGDMITFTTPYTGDREFVVPLIETIQSSLGVTGYMEQDSLRLLLELPPTVTSLILDTTEPAAIKESLLEAKQVSAITDQQEAKKIYDDLLENYGVMINMLVLAGVIIAFAIITNTATISLSERKREYATMKVMGMHPGEIGKVLGLEFWALTLLAVPPGMLIAGWFSSAVSGMIDNDIFTLPQHIEPSCYLVAAALCFVAVLLSNASARRKISRFDMVEVLKERE